MKNLKKINWVKFAVLFIAMIGSWAFAMKILPIIGVGRELNGLILDLMFGIPLIVLIIAIAYNELKKLRKTSVIFYCGSFVFARLLIMIVDHLMKIEFTFLKCLVFSVMVSIFIGLLLAATNPRLLHFEESNTRLNLANGTN